MNVGDKPLIDSLHSWVSKSRDAQSLENREQLDTLIKEVSEVPFESGLCEGLRRELSEVQSVVTELGKEEHEQLKDKIKRVKEHIFPEKVTDRLALCNKRAAQGWSTAYALTKNFDKLGFLKDLRDCSSPEDRLALCKEIAKQGDWAAKALAENFDKLGFLEDLQKCSSPERRLALCMVIAKQGKWATRGLIKNFEKLGLQKASDRLDLCKEIIKQGKWVARAVVENFEKLGLKEVSVSDRLALCKKIAALGIWAAEDLAKNFEELGLEEALASERLALCMEIAKLGWQGAEALTKNFDKLGLKEASDRLALCVEIAKQGVWAKGYLAENFGKLGFLEDLRDCSSPEDRLALCKEIAKQGEWAAKALAENFDKLGFLKDLQKCSSPERRLALCMEIAKQGKWATRGLAENFEKLGLQKASDRLALCKEIIKQGESAAGALAWNFEKLGLQEASVSDRFDLSEEIVAQGSDAARALAKNFDKLGLQEAPVSDRFDLSEEIVAQGSDAARALAKNFEKLGLQEAPASDRLDLCKEIVAQLGQDTYALGYDYDFDKLGFLKDLRDCSSPEDRLALCKEIIKQGEWAARALAKNFDKLGFLKDLRDCSSPEDRLALCKEIIKQGEWAAQGLAENFDKLGLQKASDRLALCKEIAKQGEWVARALAENFEKLGLEEALVSERLDLCKKMTAQGMFAAVDLVKNFEKLGLEEALVSERLALCMEIAKLGWRGAEALARNFESLKLQEAPVSDRLVLCMEIAKKQGGWAARALAWNFDKLASDDSERIQILFELLTLPPEIRAEFKGLIGKDYVSEVKPFLSLLLQEEININSVEFKEFEQRIAKTPIQSAYEEIKKQKTHRQQLSKWAAYSAGVLFDLEDEKSKVIEASKILDSIYHHQIPPNRFALVRQLRSLELKDLKMPDPSLVKGKKAARKQERSNLSWILLSRMKQIGFFNRDIERESILNKINGISGFVDTKKFDSLMQLLLLVIEERPYKQEEIEMIEKAISSALTQLPKKSTKEVIKEEIPNALKQLFEEKKKGNKEVIEKIEKEILNKYAQLPKNTRKKDKKDKTIIGEIKKAIPEADKKLLKLLSKPQKRQIDVISNKLHTMSNICKIFGKDELIRCLKSEEDIQSFFQKKFQTLFELEELDDFGERYQETIGSFRDKTALFSYLRCVESLPSADREKVKEAFSDYVNGVLSGDFPDIRYDFGRNPHLKTLFEGREDLIKIWLDGKQPQKVAKAEEGKSLQMDYRDFFQKKILIDKHLKPDAFPYLRDYLQGKEGKPEELDEFQALAIALCKGEKTAEEFVSEVRKLKLSLGEFENDLKALVPQKSFGEYEISESDYFGDLLVIGTEIQGSCQSVNGTPNLNKCLTGYLMNGEIRPIVVKRGDKLVARSLLRLMWDDKNNTQVLLQERLYSNVQDESINEAINTWAVDKAKRMKIPLVSKEIGKGESYNGTVKFLGGGAPFVYSDASGGVLSGAFETKGCHLLYSPKQN